MSSGSCDLLIAIGARFSDRVTGKTDVFLPNAKIVHIDIDPTSIQKIVPVAIPVVGDCKTTLEMLNSLLDKEDLGNLNDKRKTWFDQITEWKNTYRLAYEQKDIIKPQYVIEKLYELTEGNAIITTEVGQNQMWTAQYYHFDRPNCFITSGGLGVMGFGLPAAIGAQIASPDRMVVDIAGDGSIQMNIQEMATAVQYNLPVKIVILNNQYLGMVRQWQELFYEKCYACTGMEYAPDFLKLADAYGAIGLRATHPEEVVPVLKKGLSIPKTVIMEFRVEKEEKVYPMVPAGAPITDMLLV
jgi:acetolactate synthase-1/2/3 large subunit